MKKRSLLLIAIILVIMITTIYLFLNNHNHYTISSRIESVKKMNKDYKEINSWLKVQGTNIDYPVIKSSLIKNMDDIKYDYLWTNSDSNKLNNRVVIYGHNILNVSNKPLINNKNHKRFEQLLGFIYLDVVKNNKYIQYTINNKDYIYKIFSIGFIDENLDSALNINNNKEMKNYIEDSLNNSIYDFDIKVDENDKIISLFTCTRYFGYENSNIKFRVDGRLLRKEEDINNYSVKKNNNYNKVLEGEKA